MDIGTADHSLVRWVTVNSKQESRDYTHSMNISLGLAIRI